MRILPVYVCVPQRPEEALRTVVSRQPCGSWKLISGLREEQPVFLTAKYPSSPKLYILKTPGIQFPRTSRILQSRCISRLFYNPPTVILCMPATHQLAQMSPKKI